MVRRAAQSRPRAQEVYFLEMRKEITNKNYLNDHRGFSLVEVMIVVVIIGVITALALPDFNKLIGRYNLECAARELAANVRLLQENAMRYENPDYKMSFTAGSDYYLSNADTGTTVNRRIKLPAGVELAYTNFSAKRPLAFAANGNPTNFGTITLRDRASGDYRYVIIDLIGRVRVSESPPSS